MKRVIRAQVDNDRPLVEVLAEDLNDSFEDNIVVKYSKYIANDSYSEFDSSEQKKMWLNFMRAKDHYIEALAEVIEYVDVDEMI